MIKERRRSPRIRIVDTLAGRTSAGDTPVVVRDFSLGGMAIEIARELPLGTTHDFLLMLGDGSVVELRGLVMRCRNLAAAEEVPLYSCGIQFVDDEPAEASRAGQVLDRLPK
jgi:hypothetical protein